MWPCAITMLRFYFCWKYEEFAKNWKAKKRIETTVRYHNLSIIKSLSSWYHGYINRNIIHDQNCVKASYMRILWNIKHVCDVVTKMIKRQRTYLMEKKMRTVKQQMLAWNQLNSIIITIFVVIFIDSNQTTEETKYMTSLSFSMKRKIRSKKGAREHRTGSKSFSFSICFIFFSPQPMRVHLPFPLRLS